MLTCDDFELEIDQSGRLVQTVLWQRRDARRVAAEKLAPEAARGRAQRMRQLVAAATAKGESMVNIDLGGRLMQLSFSFVLTFAERLEDAARLERPGLDIAL
jgi:hypothetical protein